MNQITPDSSLHSKHPSRHAPPHRKVSLADKYEMDEGRVYVTGNQTLTKLLLLQAKRDKALGLHTAGYVSGYRGSPIGTLDMELARAKPYLAQSNIVFQSGVNEDLAATAVWGTQSLEQNPTRKVDGVFAMWYGKGPGVWRAGDAIRHGTMFGTSRYGGVLAIMGDDHSAKSSTMAYSSELDMVAHQMPILYPSDLDDYITFGLFGWALSRYCGAWVGFKAVNETIECTATIDIAGVYDSFHEPAAPVAGHVHYTPYRGPDTAKAFEDMMFHKRRPRALAFARANGIDKLVLAAPKPQLGIISAGKAYKDVLGGLKLLGLDMARARKLGISIYKPGMIWPLEPENVQNFALQQKELLVVEEKTGLMQGQIADMLINWPDSQRPRLTGKTTPDGEPQLPMAGVLDAPTLARVIAARLMELGLANKDISDAAAKLAKQTSLGAVDPSVPRKPYFCAGCPHNSSLALPEGAIAYGGIGCHMMKSIFEPDTTQSVTQMGGEGGTWVGVSHFVDTPHVFQNLGDGTYTHSGMLAVYNAVAQNTNITFKILFNDAVAMTGGQAAEGHLQPWDIAHQLQAFGVKDIAVVSDEPEKYKPRLFPNDCKLYHRCELIAVQNRLRDVKGVSALIYDQTCAAEKRRRRKRSQFPNPAKRLFIHPDVCEACGDCSVQSHCIAIQTTKTPDGNKRVIAQSLCNKDYACNQGFCPSFVTALGGELQHSTAYLAYGKDLFSALPLPATSSNRDYAILIGGIGGTGVVTIGAVLGMAAHIEGKGASVYDMTGMAQKGGMVLSHLHITSTPAAITTATIDKADVVLGCDLVVAAGQEVMERLQLGHSHAVVNSDPVATMHQVYERDFELPTDSLQQGLRKALGKDVAFVDATHIATELMGDSIAGNFFVVGYAFQQGLIPLDEASIMEAIELNGVAIGFNQTAFRLGRLAAHDFAQIETLLTQAHPPLGHGDMTSHATPMSYEQRLVAYQNQAYADSYGAQIDAVAAADKALGKGDALTQAVRRNLFKLMAYKDEYEVARLFTQTPFLAQVKGRFAGKVRLRFNMAPPIFARKDPVNGRPLKRSFGSWMLWAMRGLARLKFLRGTIWDVFGYSAERREERRLIADYKALLARLLPALTPANYNLAVALASLPDGIRGYGPVKAANIVRVKAEQDKLLQAWQAA